MSYPVIIFTFQGRNNYLRSTLSWLREEFKEKEIIVFTDYNSPVIENISFFEGNDENWAVNLRNCFQKSKLVEKYDYAFLLIEDLIPTKPVNFKTIDNYYQYMLSHKSKCIVFPTFKCFWGPVFDKISSENTGDHKIYTVPDYFEYYSQLQPALWDLNYFLKLLNLIIIEKGDPWSFEKSNIGEKHLVAEYCWPNMIGGYVESGKVNKHFLKENLFNSYLPTELRTLLLKEYIKQKFRKLLNN